MQKQISFIAEFASIMKYLFPFMFIAAVALGAVFSQGSWSTMMDKSLPLYLGIMGGLWLVLSLYAAFHRKVTGVNPFSATNNAGSNYPGGDEMTFNPASGSPMPGDGTGGLDLAGNEWGHSSNDIDTDDD